MNPSDMQLSRTLHHERIYNSDEQRYPKQSASQKIREFQFVDQVKAFFDTSQATNN